MPPRRFSLRRMPRPVRPPLALAVVGGVVTAVIATGQPAAPAGPAGGPVLAASGTTTGRAVAATLGDQVQVARALRALEARRGAGHASRSESRRPLQRRTPKPHHRW